MAVLVGKKEAPCRESDCGRDVVCDSRAHVAQASGAVVGQRASPSLTQLCRLEGAGAGPGDSAGCG